MAQERRGVEIAEVGRPWSARPICRVWYRVGREMEREQTREKY